MTNVNPHLKNLLNRAENRFSEDRLSMSMTDWVTANTRLRGKSFSIQGREFQREILDDMHPNMDVIKCSQIGMTEIQLRKLLAFLMRTTGVAGIFTLPTEPMFKRVSATRIKPLVEGNPIFNTERDHGAVRNQAIMQFGESFLYVTGCSENDATSTPADIVFNDEVDISPQNMLALFNSRMQDSSYRISQRFGTPTFPGYGIHAGFEASDQHLYLCRCEACNHWNWPEFTRRFIEIPGLPDNIEHLHDIDQLIVDRLDIMGSMVVCEKCRRPLDLGNPDLRAWVPKYPGRTHARGRYVTPFSTDRLPPSYILQQLLKYRQREYLRGWFNTVLGMPYDDGNVRLDFEAIKACFTSISTVPTIDPTAPCWIGIDIGQTCHIVLGTGNSADDMHVFLFEALPEPLLMGRVLELCETYNIRGGAVDRHPYEPTARDLFQATDGKIVPAEYRGTREVNLVFNSFEEFTHAQVDRTMALDEVARVIRRRLIRFSGYGHYQSVIIEHLRDMWREDSPEKPATWIKLSGNDHYFHALGSLLVSLKIKDLERVKSKVEIRTMAFYEVAEFPGSKDGLIGKQNKAFVNPLLSGYNDR